MVSNLGGPKWRSSFVIASLVWLAINSNNLATPLIEHNRVQLVCVQHCRVWTLVALLTELAAYLGDATSREDNSAMFWQRDETPTRSGGTFARGACSRSELASQLCRQAGARADGAVVGRGSEDRHSVGNHDGKVRG